MTSFNSAQNFFILNGQSKIFELIEKTHVPEPFVSRAKALPAKRSEKSNGDKNVIDRAGCLLVSMLLWL